MAKELQELALKPLKWKKIVNLPDPFFDNALLDLIKGSESGLCIRNDYAKFVKPLHTPIAPPDEMRAILGAVEKKDLKRAVRAKKEKDKALADALADADKLRGNLFDDVGGIKGASPDCNVNELSIAITPEKANKRKEGKEAAGRSRLNREESTIHGRSRLASFEVDKGTNSVETRKIRVVSRVYLEHDHKSFSSNFALEEVGEAGTDKGGKVEDDTEENKNGDDENQDKSDGRDEGGEEEKDQGNVSRTGKSVGETHKISEKTFKK